MSKIIFIFLAIFSFQAAGGEASIVKDRRGSIGKIEFAGDSGSATHSLFNFIDFFHSTPLQGANKSEYSGKNFTAERWVKDQTDMDGEAYKVSLEFDGLNNIASEEKGVIRIEGRLAEMLVIGMWNMYLAHGDNFTVTRGRYVGDIKLADLYSNRIECEIATRDMRGSHLVEKFASCALDLR